MYEDIDSVGMVSTVESQLRSSEIGERDRQDAYLLVNIEQIHEGIAHSGRVRLS